MGSVRLQKFLAEGGVASRRQSEAYILAGHVKVNGKVVRELGTKIDPSKDNVSFLEKEVKVSNKVVLMLNKPKGYITTRKDPTHRKTVFDLLPENYQHLHAVGRLDRNTTGLLLFTNDGELTHILLHPKHKLVKKYRVEIKQKITVKKLSELATGLMLEGKRTLPLDVEVLDDTFRKMELSLREGRNRQIRKMFEMLGYEVVKLKRFQMGDLKLGKLRLGEFRILSSREIKGLTQLPRAQKYR